jgi:hypothetical protein
MIGYYEKHKNKRNEGSSSRQGLQDKGLDSFDEALISLNLGLSQLESERLRMTLDGGSKNSNNKNSIPQSLILKTIMSDPNDVDREDKGGLDQKASIENSDGANLGMFIKYLYKYVLQDFLRNVPY